MVFIRLRHRLRKKVSPGVNPTAIWAFPEGYEVFASCLRASAAYQPDWPAGMPAPADHPPAVIAPVRVLVDGQPAKVTRAVLAPGYVGFYLVEFDTPEFLNAGVAEITVQAAGQDSNPVRIYTMPE